ncbi:RadC family protein [bacterium]|nr:RadC family protein [bacterium]
MANTPDDVSCAGHRQRLRDKFVKNQLADYERIELMLTYAIARRDVRQPARALMKKFGSVYQILTAPLEELASVKGVGMVSAICIKQMHDLMTIGFKEYMIKQPFYKDYGGFENYCRLVVGGKAKEEVHVLYLGANDCLIEEEVHSKGTSNESAIYVQNILQKALKTEAHSIIMIHNHPTAMTSFSDDDIKTTLELHELLKHVGIVFRDHYVVSGSIIYSARNMHIIVDESK